MRNTITAILLSSIMQVCVATPLNLYTVTAQPVSQTLYFNGTVTPIRMVPVISPTAGVIDQKFFMYGQVVKQGQALLHIQTDQLLDNLWSAKVDYLNAATDFNKLKNWHASADVMNAQNNYDRAERAFSQDQNTYQQNQELYKLGIISEQELTNSKNNSEDSQASLIQAKMSLQQTLNQGQGDSFMIGELKLKAAEQKFKSLQTQYHATTILAPATGIALALNNNVNTDSSSPKNPGKVNVSSLISYQQVLLNIGDTSGIKVSFNVPEININQVQKGQTAAITGAGFPNINLTGKVVDVAAQANTNDSSVPTFPVTVAVASISEQDRQQIRSGMDAQVALKVYSANQAIVVPVNAVSQNSQGQSIVQVYNPTSQTSNATVVTTGTVTTNQVQIVSGVTAGQQIVMP